MFISSVLGSNSCWANPVVMEIDASLEHNINHAFSTDIFALDLDAAGLPGLKHLVLTLPLSCKHDTVVGYLIQIVDVLHAEFNFLVLSANISKVRVVFSVQPVSTNQDILALEEIVQVLTTNIVV